MRHLDNSSLNVYNTSASCVSSCGQRYPERGLTIKTFIPLVTTILRWSNKNQLHKQNFKMKLLCIFLCGTYRYKTSNVNFQKV